MHSVFGRPLLGFWVLLVVLFLTRLTARGDILEYSKGHSDIRTEFAGGRIDLKWGFDAGAVLGGNTLTSSIQLDPSNVVARVSDAAIFSTSSSIYFLGNTPGANIWILPFNNDPDLPFLGTNSESLFGFNPPFTSNSLQLVGFSGPGNFALWQTGPFGEANVFLRTNDGLSNLDIINPIVGSHAHYNWGFTAEGVYDLTILATASRGGVDFSDTDTFRFVVGSSTAVPEPGSLALLSIVGAGAFLLANRNRILVRTIDQA